MGSHENLTHKWLRQNIQPYAHKDTLFQHVDTALTRYPTIRPKTDVYTFDDGRTQLLLCLHGLLPITFRGASYNIPIAVWLTREYPQRPPIAYVVPTSDMLVRPGPEMDVSGKCQIQYLLNWERKPEGCSLVGVLEAMQDNFSRLPPVYSKPARAATQPATRSPAGPDYTSRPPPPVPGTHAATHSQTVSPSPIPAVNNDAPPPLPAKPGTPAISPALASISRTPSVQSPAPAHAHNPAPGILGNPALGMRPPPPIPPHSPMASGVQAASNSPVLPTYTPHAPGRPIDVPGGDPAPLSRAASSSGPPGNSSFDPRLAQPPLLPPQASRPPLSTEQSPPPIPPHPPNSSGVPVVLPHGTYPLPVSPTGGVLPGGPPPTLPPPFVSPQPPADYVPPHYHRPPAAPTPPVVVPVQPLPPAVPPPAPHIEPPDILDAEDLSAVQVVGTPVPEAPAPPRPPNPELLRLHEQVQAKLRSELASLQQAMALDAERLRAHQADLLAGEPAIRDEMARLEAVRDVCRTVAGRMRGVVDAGARNVAELRRKGDPEVDELVCSTTIVHNQLINLVAEDNSIEDTIYHLHRALNSGRIDLEKFIRTTRALAEEQFMKRALIEKIQAGLPQDDPGLRWTTPAEWR